MAPGSFFAAPQFPQLYNIPLRQDQLGRQRLPETTNKASGCGDSQLLGGGGCRAQVQMG